MFIHKTTAVWLFQEGERVSPDRLIRVRETQPNTTFKIISCQNMLLSQNLIPCSLTFSLLTF